MPISLPMLPDGDLMGESMHELMRELFPILRSRTGNGVRETLAILGRDLPLEVVETPTGTQVFDWEVPDEWNVQAAWIDGPDGTRVVDMADSTLHLVGYSLPVDTMLTLEELRPHIHSDPSRPDLIPYRVAYKGDTWGFSMPHARLEALPEGSYRVHIDATLAPGSLSYGETTLPGESGAVFLLTAAVCHPALANDNLSGVVLLWALAKLLAEQPRRRFTYRLLWSPGTLGPLAWLHHNHAMLDRVAYGIVVSCAGDPRPVTVKRSRRGTAEIDRIAEHVLGHIEGAILEDWYPWGGDERQLCSPGFDLPVATFSRSPHGQYPEYHTSADDLDLVRPAALDNSLRVLLEMIDVAESDAVVRNTLPYGEPRLGARGLYRGASPEEDERHLFWVLSLADGANTLLDIACRSGVPFRSILNAARRLESVGLVEWSR